MKTESTIIKPTIEHARKIIEYLKLGLVAGIGVQEPGKMCVEALKCYVLGLPHGDNPPCVGQAVRDFYVKLNDCNWSSNEARAKGLRAGAIAQLGSNTLDQIEFGNLMFLRSTQKLLPLVFRKVANDKSITNEEQRKKYLEHADKCKAVKTFDEARAETKAAYAYASAYASDYASASAYAYAYASDYAWFRNNLGDELLIATADIGVSVLKELKSPGCKWLHLVKD